MLSDSRRAQRVGDSASYEVPTQSPRFIERIHRPGVVAALVLITSFAGHTAAVQAQLPGGSLPGHPFYATCPEPVAAPAVPPPLSVPSYTTQPHLAFRPPADFQPRLIVLLHGAKGDASNMSDVAEAFAKAGFRTLALTWNEYPVTGTARNRCLLELGFDMVPVARFASLRDWSDASMDDDLALNTCLVEIREDKANDPIAGVIPQLVDALLHLKAVDPQGDWGSFLLQAVLPSGQLGPAVPRWAKIVQAGYSEGANQTAYMLRQHPYFGGILISGGGDAGVVDTSIPDIPVADWMYPELPEDARLVGLWDLGETHDYQFGWTLSGMSSEVADVDPGTMSYGPYLGAHRLRHYCWNFDPAIGHVVGCNQRQAHASTVQPALEIEHMYLACKSGA